jgi:hypothetical protein
VNAPHLGEVLGEFVRMGYLKASAHGDALFRNPLHDVMQVCSKNP